MGRRGRSASRTRLRGGRIVKRGRGGGVNRGVARRGTRGGKVAATRGRKVAARGKGRAAAGRVGRGRGRGKKVAAPNKDALDKELDTFMQER